MKIKICGMCDEKNIEEVAGLMPDYMGFIFYKNSARYAGKIKKETVKKIPLQIIKTAVFVNETIENILSVVDSFGFDHVQLHGDESVSYCAELKAQLKEKKIIKALAVSSAGDIEESTKYDSVCDYILFDTKSKLYGGSGLQFDHHLLSEYKGELPFFLSGGIGLEDIDRILAEGKKINSLYALDLNSKFEVSPGRKDVKKISEAIFKIRNN